MGRAIPRDHSSGLAAAHDHGAPSDEREDRWKLEVVIADVVRRHLIGPTEAACPSREDDEGVRVLDVAGVVATVRTLRRPTPGVGIRRAPVDIAFGVDGRGLPRPAAACHLRVPPGGENRVEAPPDASSRRVEAEEDASATGRHPGRARQHQPAVRDHRRNRDRVHGRGEPCLPDHASSTCIEREGAFVRVPEDHAAGCRHPIRAVAGAREPRAPQRVPIGERKSLDVAVEILDEDGALTDDRGRCGDAREAGPTGKRVAPHRSQRRDVAGTNLGPDCRPRARYAGVRHRPFARATRRGRCRRPGRKNDGEANSARGQPEESAAQIRPAPQAEKRDVPAAGRGSSGGGWSGGRSSCPAPQNGG